MHFILSICFETDSDFHFVQNESERLSFDGENLHLTIFADRMFSLLRELSMFSMLTDSDAATVTDEMGALSGYTNQSNGDVEMFCKNVSLSSFLSGFFDAFTFI